MEIFPKKNFKLNFTFNKSLIEITLLKNTKTIGSYN